MLDETRKEAYTQCMADIDDMFKIEALVYVPDLLFRKYEMGKFVLARQLNLKRFKLKLKVSFFHEYFKLWCPMRRSLTEPGATFCPWVMNILGLKEK